MDSFTKREMIASAMHTIDPAQPLMIFALLGILAGAIMTSPPSEKQPERDTDGFVQPAKDLPGAIGSAQSEYANAWQKIKTNSENQIRDNDALISKFKDQRTRVGKAFRAVYDKRVAELERRNTGIKIRLDSYKPFPPSPSSEQ